MENLRYFFNSLDSDAGNALETIQALINGFFSILPKLVLAIIIFILIIIIGRFFSFSVKRAFKSKKKNLGLALSRIVMMCFYFIGLLISVAIIAPTIGAAELFQLLGIGSVAIGFAFRDILQNFLAGLLILFRQPFTIGDTVVFEGEEGIVEEIETRATYIRKYDGQRIIIPNGKIFTNIVTVVTADPNTRSEYDFGISYNADLDKAIHLIEETIKSTEGVLSEPKPDVGVIELDSSSVNLRARWWTDAASRYKVHLKILQKTKQNLDQAGINIPFPTRLVHVESKQDIS